MTTTVNSGMHRCRLTLLSRLEELLKEESLIVKELADLESAERYDKETEQIIEQRNRHFESMRGTVIHYGDIISPVTDPDDWEANR